MKINSFFLIALLALTWNAASAAEATYETAAEFVASRAPSTEYEYYEGGGFVRVKFQATQINLRRAQWIWEERELKTVHWPDNSRREISKNTKYTVAPSKLASNVEVKHGLGVWYLVLDCASRACITISGTRATDAGETEQISRTSPNNIWLFGDENSARRVAKALEHMIKLSGGTASAF